jgi:hypothetical protein
MFNLYFQLLAEYTGTGQYCIETRHLSSHQIAVFGFQYFKGRLEPQTNLLVNRWSSLSTEHNQYDTHLSASILTTKETALLQQVTSQANMLSANL